jgi:hypothetical protein
MILDIFEDGSMRTFRIDRGLPDDYEIVKFDRVMYGNDFSVEVLVIGTFNDGGQDGDLFDILVTNIQS